MTRGFLAVVGAGALPSLLATGCSASRGLPPLETAAHVDLVQYAGPWFQIAALGASSRLAKTPQP